VVSGPHKHINLYISELLQLHLGTCFSYVPCEQQLLFELVIHSGDFYVMYQRENHFINNRLQKPRRLNLKWMPAVNNNSQS
jgi:hypothetical protein